MTDDNRQEIPTQPFMVLGRMIRELAAIQRDQAEANRQFLGALQAQMGRQAQALEQLAGRPAAPPPAPGMAALAGLTLHRLTAGDDVQAYLEAFEATAEACGWPEDEWPVRLLPLLSGEAQTAAMGLPPAARREYAAVRKAVVDRLGLLPEDHRRRFREARLGPEDRPFSYGQRLKDSAARWLLPNGPGGAQAVMEKVVLEQLMVGLPERTAAWVQCHRPPTVEAAVTLAEDHLAVHPSGGGRQLRPAERPTPAPRRATLPPAYSPRTAADGGAIPDPQGVSQTPGQACWRCGQPGHLRRDCPLMEVGQVIRVAGAPAPSPGPGATYRVPVSIQGGIRQAMMDSGCSQSMIHQSLVRPGALVEASRVRIRCVHGDIHEYPIVSVELRFKGKKYRIKVAVSSHLTHPVILGTDWAGFNTLMGQAAGVRSRPTGICDTCAVLSGDARSSDAAEGEGEPAEPPVETPAVPEFRSMEDFPLEQSRDDTLRSAYDQVIKIDGQLVRPDAAQSYPHFSLIRDRLYRVSRDTRTGEENTQLLVPKSRREMIFQAAHYNPMAGHMGYGKTLDRIMTRFYWPGIRGDARRWCASCPECQLVNSPAIPRAPLRPLPLVEVPFERIGMDLIGPFYRSSRGYRFVLVLMDYATRYPEAVPLRNISAKSVAQALFQVISRVGIPKEILTDQGTSFMSRTLRELYGLLGIKSVRTSVYHPQTDGLVERMNRTLKSMIRKFISEDERNWDQWLDPLLFAVREVPQASTGFSPFELLFGRSPRGVLDLIKESWEEGPSPGKNEIQYVLDLRAKLHTLGRMSRENLLQAQERQQRLYDRGARLREFTPGEKTDASDRGLGAVLSQEVGGVDRPVVYISRKLSEREARYSTVEKECLAIRWAVDSLRYYLLGRPFTLCSDHAPLQWLHRMKDTNARITRWYLAMQPFNFKVVHRPGTQMVVADFLSRPLEGGGGE
ncbi:uncharacterized protein LOC134129059 [Pungitius pungitius]|uniref:uncharacterized protein LOC134129059 n=1 Tax=Pungitius pungitius TaxID=134920 RepID=UPI002E13837E